MTTGAFFQAPVASGSQATQQKVSVYEDSDSDFQSFPKSVFRYMPSSDPFKGFKKKLDMVCNSLCFLYMNK